MPVRGEGGHRGSCLAALGWMGSWAGGRGAAVLLGRSDWLSRRPACGLVPPGPTGYATSREVLSRGCRRCDCRRARTAPPDPLGQGPAPWVVGVPLERRAEEWFLRRSAGRRWLPTLVEEWRLLPAAGAFGPAFHVLRALCGGLRGPAGARSTADRCGNPWRCDACGRPGAKWAWRTPGPATPGLAFYVDCLGGGGGGKLGHEAGRGLPSGWLGAGSPRPSSQMFPSLACWPATGPGAPKTLVLVRFAASVRVGLSTCCCGAPPLFLRGGSLLRIAGVSWPR